MLKLRQVKIALINQKSEALKTKIAQKLHLKENEILDWQIKKEAIDARDKNNILLVYEVVVKVAHEEKVKLSPDVMKWEEDVYQLPEPGLQVLSNNIVIVGAGPAGLFAAYILTEAGFKPIIIERGKKVEDRVKDVETFWQKGVLNPESNVQFGEGGAGTFSDGKLNTLIKDKRHLGQKVLDIFVANGAPAEISYKHNPHIGTDNLRQLVKNMREEIIKRGGEFLYETKLTNLFFKGNKITSIEVNHQEIIPVDALILAIGHSARDTFQLLKTKNITMENKPFAVGIRIMHPQELINQNQYGKYAEMLPPASYKLTFTTKNNRGVYSFCMCPGGYVVNASSELSRLVINGMSNYARDSKVANSAIVVTVKPTDYGSDPLAGLKWQEQLETLAYQAGDGKIPLQLWGDFVQNKASTSLGKIKPQLKGDYVLTNIRAYLPTFISEALLEAMPNFEQKIKGFADPDALIAIIESRTSSPVRIIRDENYEANIKGIYPAGEGAGYAGGIITSAIDGIKVAEAIIKKYQA